MLTNPLLASRRLNHIIVASLDIDRGITDPAQHNLGIEENTKESFDPSNSKSTTGQKIVPPEWQLGQYFSFSRITLESHICRSQIICSNSAAALCLLKSFFVPGS